MALFFKKAKARKENISLEKENLPAHVGIIMDGNGRWAKKRNLPRSAGHKEGAQNFRTITKYCSTIGIKYLTVYAFSTENWKRPQDEIGALMSLFESYLEEAISDFTEEDIVVKFIGDRSAFSPKLRTLIDKNEQLSANRTGMVLNIAMNYGGRDEIIMAVKNIAKEIKKGELSPENINEKIISDNLYTAGQPDPDLVIRPSGEYRTSNFLIWQSAYTEYSILDVLWPDFTTAMLDDVLLDYAKRNRRFGGL